MKLLLSSIPVPSPRRSPFSTGLWSIMDFSNRGLPGTLKEFKDTYGAPIERLNNLETAEKLKKVIAPFLMRRLKSDKSIISDLPDKIEIDSFATLTSEQAGLNEKTLIFIRFTEMGNLLHQFIRDKIFILSLKTAGTGLNLTAASHVIHYDLWWNTAVEAQATDRAFGVKL
jgi:SNF2 family DNA or RNA helicase